jgi:molecular chaperone GrpE (heat shock protein)
MPCWTRVREMSEETEKAGQYRQRAARLRSIAQEYGDRETAEKLMAVAQDYERMAQAAEGMRSGQVSAPSGLSRS